MRNKSFIIKIYNKTGATLIQTLNPSIVKTLPSFSSQINGGLGQCALELNLPFDAFGEGSIIDFMYIAKIFVTDANNPLGRLVYTGFISSYQPYIDSTSQGVKVTLLGLVSLLSFAYYKSGASFTVTHTTVDPSAIMKAIIDHFNSIYSGSLLGYNSDGTTVDPVGTNVSYVFNERRWLDALKDTFSLAGGGRWWALNKLGQLYLKEKPSSATHTFTIGKDIELLEVNKSSEGVVNKVRVKYGVSTSDSSDATSITRFGTRESILTDSQAQDATTAGQKGAAEITDNKVEKIKARLTINSLYDIESIQPGDTCKIRNLAIDQATFNDNMQIVSVAYNLDKVVLELEEMTRFSIELQKFIA